VPSRVGIWESAGIATRISQPDESAEGFWARVRRGPACWDRRGARGADGYGVLKWKGRTERAHRMAWAVACGAVPARHRVIQVCGNRACCRPDHLELRAPVNDDPVSRASDARQRNRKAAAGRGHLERRGPEHSRLVVYRGRDRATSRRRYERSLFHGSDDEAQVALARFIVELADANYELDPRQLNVGDLLDLWYEHVQPDLEATTAETYRHELGYVPDRLRSLPLRRLTTEHLEEMYRKLRTSGRKREGQGLSQKSSGASTSDLTPRCVSPSDAAGCSSILWLTSSSRTCASPIAGVRQDDLRQLVHRDVERGEDQRRRGHDGERQQPAQRETDHDVGPMVDGEIAAGPVLLDGAAREEEHLVGRHGGTEEGDGVVAADEHRLVLGDAGVGGVIEELAPIRLARPNRGPSRSRTRSSTGRPATAATRPHISA
jgi:HNH endonuclease